MIEDFLDTLAEYARPAREQHDRRRVRAIGLQLSAVRVAEVRKYLLRSGVPDIERRIHVLPDRLKEGDPGAGGTISLTPHKVRRR